MPPSQVGPPEDDVADEVPGIAPPTHGRTSSSMMAQEPSDDMFGPQNSWEVLARAGEGVHNNILAGEKCSSN